MTKIICSDCGGDDLAVTDERGTLCRDCGDWVETTEKPKGGAKARCPNCGSQGRQRVVGTAEAPQGCTHSWHDEHRRRFVDD
jgi:DNA-directed RNA polymerase subunit RPC12/RpoP